jgi:hypothetical protein
MAALTPENPVVIEPSRFKKDEVLFRFAYLFFKRWDESTYVIDLGIPYSLKTLAFIGLGDAERGKEMVFEFIQEKQRNWPWLQSIMGGDNKPSPLEIQAHALKNKLLKKD